MQRIRRADGESPVKDVASIAWAMTGWPIVASFSALVIWGGVGRGIPSLWFPLILGGWLVMLPVWVWLRYTQPVSASTQVLRGENVARNTTIICGVAIVVGSFAPWVEGLGWMDAQAITYHGVWRTDGQLTFLLGLLICGVAGWRTMRYRIAASLLVMAACGAAMFYAIRVWADPYRFGTYTIEGWLWMEPRWGITLVLIGAVLGLLANAFLVLANRGRWHTDVHR